MKRSRATVRFLPGKRAGTQLRTEADERPPDTWFFEVILLELMINIPVKVHRRGTVPKLAATRDFAKKMFLERFFDETYAVKHRRLKPEGVRIVDEENAEVLRFTVGDFYQEAGFQPESSDPASSEFSAQYCGIQGSSPSSFRTCSLVNRGPPSSIALSAK